MGRSPSPKRSRDWMLSQGNPATQYDLFFRPFDRAAMKLSQSDLEKSLPSFSWDALEIGRECWRIAGLKLERDHSLSGVLYEIRHVWCCETGRVCVQRLYSEWQAPGRWITHELGPITQAAV